MHCTTVLSPFQAAARKRCRQHMVATDEYIHGAPWATPEGGPVSGAASVSGAGNASGTGTNHLLGTGGGGAEAVVGCVGGLSPAHSALTGGEGGYAGGRRRDRDREGAQERERERGGGEGRDSGGGGAGAGGGGGGVGVSGVALGGDAQSVAYSRMRALCIALGREIRADIALHNQHIFPRYGAGPLNAVQFQYTQCSVSSCREVSVHTVQFPVHTVQYSDTVQCQ